MDINHLSYGAGGWIGAMIGIGYVMMDSHRSYGTYVVAGGLPFLFGTALNMSIHSAYHVSTSMFRWDVMFVTWAYVFPLAATIIMVGHNALTWILQYEKYRYVRQRAAEMAAEEEEVEEEEGWAVNWGRRRATAAEAGEEEEAEDGEEEAEDEEEAADGEEEGEAEGEEGEAADGEAEGEVKEEAEGTQEKVVVQEDEVPLPSSPTLDTAFIVGSNTPSEVEDTWVDDCILKNEHTEFTEDEKKSIIAKLETLATHSYFN